MQQHLPVPALPWLSQGKGSPLGQYGKEKARLEVPGMHQQTGNPPPLKFLRTSSYPLSNSLHRHCRLDNTNGERSNRPSYASSSSFGGTASYPLPLVTYVLTSYNIQPNDMITKMPFSINTEVPGYQEESSDAAVNRSNVIRTVQTRPMQVMKTVFTRLSVGDSSWGLRVGPVSKFAGLST